MCAKPRGELLACAASPNRQLAVGGAHACLVKFDSTLWCWGRNDHGQVGDSTSVDRNEPVLSADRNVGWASVTAGTSHTCALKRDGSAWCWGANPDGRLGSGDSDDHPSPVPVASKATWVVLSAASDRTCGTQGDGSLWCWGRGSSKPSKMGDGVTFIGAGDQNLCTLSPERELDCLGKISGSWEKISVGSAHYCAIDSGNSLMCSGADDSGQIGDGMTSPMSTANLGSGYVLVSAGAASTCAIRATGALECWGKNDVGQLGVGGTDPKSLPAPVGTDLDWLLVATGESSTCGVRQNGRVQCWGANDRGQIGDGTASPRPVPTDVAF
jgi:alpha-tubulin suppressor-like RCC1 family protein